VGVDVTSTCTMIVNTVGQLVGVITFAYELRLRCFMHRLKVSERRTLFKVCAHVLDIVTHKNAILCLKMSSEGSIPQFSKLGPIAKMALQDDSSNQNVPR
jgi:hypothetical protein